MHRARTVIPLLGLVGLLAAWFAMRGGTPEGPLAPVVGLDARGPAPEDAGASPALEVTEPADGRVVAAADAVPPTVIAVEGIVLRARRPGEADHVPLPGARLQAGPWSPPTDFHADEEGRFRFELEHAFELPTAFMISAGGGDSGFLEWSRRIDFAAGVDTVRDVRVLLVEPCPVTGRVVDPQGRPVAGASLRVDGGPPAVSDASGRFVLAGVSDELLAQPRHLEESVAAELDGWDLLAVEVPGFDGDGVWGGVQVVMTGAGSLAVQALGSDGQPVAGLEVVLAVLRDERFGARPERVLGFKKRAMYATTDAEGRVRFERVPADVHLVVDVQDQRYTAVVAAGQGGAPRLAAARASAGRPLVVATGEDRAVELVMDRTLRLTGRVLEVDGTGSPEAELVLRLEAPADTPPGATDPALTPFRVRTDAEGRFDERLHVLGDAHAFTAYARSRVGERPSYSMFGGTVYADPLMVASARVELASAGDEVDLQLQLARAEGIAGTVVDAQGAPVKFARVRVLDRPGGREATSALGHGIGGTTPEAGTFTLDLLLPGTYTVEATSSAHGVAEVEGVQTGAEGLVVRFGEAPPATVTLEVVCERPIGTLSVSRARLDADAELAARAPLLGSSAEFRDPVRFPPSASLIVSGTTSFTDGGYRGRFHVELWPEPRKTFTVAPGLHWFAARGSDGDGARLFPMGTGPVRLGAGEHRITLHLVPTAAVDVRVEGADAGPPLVLRARTASGEVVPCGGIDGWPRAHFDLASDGTVVLESVPAVPLQLELGTWAELDAGTPRARAAVHPEPGERTGVVMEVR